MCQNLDTDVFLLFASIRKAPTSAGIEPKPLGAAARLSIFRCFQFLDFNFFPLYGTNIIRTGSMFTWNSFCCSAMCFPHRQHFGPELKLPLNWDSCILPPTKMSLRTHTLPRVLPTVGTTSRWLPIINDTIQSVQC